MNATAVRHHRVRLDIESTCAPLLGLAQDPYDGIPTLCTSTIKTPGMLG
jgi:hypothetical protein